MRPTSSRVREAIFNLLVARIDLDGKRVLDLFSGTGALGIEAISRNAGHCVFVEIDPHAVSASHKNVESLAIGDLCTIVRADVRVFLSRQPMSHHDLILADPPYDLDYLGELPDLVRQHLAPGGFFVLEHDKRWDFSEHQNLVSARSYGSTRVAVFNENGEK